MTSFKIVYYFNEKLTSSFLYRYTIHSDNFIDADGNLVKNVGGSILLSYRKDTDPPVANFLDGEKVTTNLYELTLRYLLSYNLNFVLRGEYSTYAKIKNDKKTFLSSLQINYNFY